MTSEYVRQLEAETARNWRRLPRARPLIGASPPLLLAVLVVKLWLTGTLRYYVNDRTVWIVLLGALLFALVGAASLSGAVRASPRSEQEPQLSWRTIAFLVPVVVGLVIPARPLSASSGQASSLGSLQLASHVSSGGGGDLFGYWVSALADHPDPGWWAGQKVTLVGFAARQVGLPARSFIVGRYLVTCCVVDATLLGFPVQLDAGHPGPKGIPRVTLPAEGEWVQVSGSFGREYWIDPSGAHYPLIVHAHISAVTIPSSPYLSP